MSKVQNKKRCFFKEFDFVGFEDVQTWVKMDKLQLQPGYHWSSHSVRVESSVAERVRGRTGYNTCWTTVTDCRICSPTRPSKTKSSVSDNLSKKPNLPNASSSITFHDRRTFFEYSCLSETEFFIPEWIFSERYNDCRKWVQCFFLSTNRSNVKNVFWMIGFIW